MLHLTKVGGRGGERVLTFFAYKLRMNIEGVCVLCDEKHWVFSHYDFLTLLLSLMFANIEMKLTQ